MLWNKEYLTVSQVFPFNTISEPICIGKCNVYVAISSHLEEYLALKTPNEVLSILDTSSDI